MKVKAGVSASGNGNRNQMYPYRSPSVKQSRVAIPPRKTAAGPKSPPILPQSETLLDSSSSSSSSSGSEDDSGHEQEETAPVIDLTSGDGNDSTRAPLSATLTNLNVLDCPICCGSLFAPVYQCENGHISCSSCCARMANKCPNCCLPTGTIRCRALETVLESVKVKCLNTQYGCTEAVTYNKKLDHEKKCSYSPCSCPHSNCNHIDMPTSLYEHFSRCHSHSSVQFSFLSKISISLYSIRPRVYLQDESRSTLFILDRMVKSPGSFVSVVCVGPDSWKGAFSYDLTAVIDRDTHVQMKAGIECMRKWTADAAFGKCLVLPSDLVEKWRMVNLELIIRRNPEFSGEGTAQVCEERIENLIHAV